VEAVGENDDKIVLLQIEFSFPEHPGTHLTPVILLSSDRYSET
jgi:hypothetical protein